MKGEPTMPERKDWSSPWFNRYYWIMDHLEDYQFEPNEFLVIMVMNFMQETGQLLTPDSIGAKTNLSESELDTAFSSLSAKGLLGIDFLNRQVRFSLEGLADVGQSQPMSSSPIVQTLIREFSSEFGRPLSGSEMERILALGDEYEEDMVLRALDEAAAYGKRSVSYIEAMLNDWKRRGLDAADIESGRR